MTGLIDWDHWGIISQSIGLYNRWRLARLARKPRRCSMLLATAAVKDTAPINPNQQEQTTWGALEHKARPEQCGNHQRYAFYFAPSRDTSKKNRGKGQEKGTSSWTNPGSAAETPERKNPTQPPTPFSPFPLHPTCFLMAVFWAARLKNSPWGTLRIQFHTKQIPRGGDGRRRRMGRRRRQGIRTSNKKEIYTNRQAILRGEI